MLCKAPNTCWSSPDIGRWISRACFEGLWWLLKVWSGVLHLRITLFCLSGLESCCFFSPRCVSWTLSGSSCCSSTGPLETLPWRSCCVTCSKTELHTTLCADFSVTQTDNVTDVCLLHCTHVSCYFCKNLCIFLFCLLLLCLPLLNHETTVETLAVCFNYA